MAERIPCKNCGKEILEVTAKNTDGYCMPCKKAFDRGELSSYYSCEDELAEKYGWDFIEGTSYQSSDPISKELLDNIVTQVKAFIKPEFIVQMSSINGGQRVGFSVSFIVTTPENEQFSFTMDQNRE